MGQAACLTGAGCSGVTSSGQMRCQSSGRSSRRVTAPEVACSMLAQCSGGTNPPRLRQLLTADWVTPMATASALTPPACFVASVSASMAGDYHERVNQVNTGVILGFCISRGMDSLPSRLAHARELRNLTQTPQHCNASFTRSHRGPGLRGPFQSSARSRLTP